MSSGKFHISDMRFKIMTAVFAVMLASAVLSLMVKAAVTISKAEYEGEGRIAVAFSTEVSYENVKIAVTDSAGISIRSRASERRAKRRVPRQAVPPMRRQAARYPASSGFLSHTVLYRSRKSSTTKIAGR